MITFKPPSFVEFEEIKISKGKHSSRPYWWSYQKREGLKMQFVFASSTAYDLESSDQKDWNKLCGLSFHWWTNHRNSAMVSWRYNPESKLIELGFYYHKDGVVIKANSSETGEVFASIRPSQNIKCHFDVKGQTVETTIITPSQTVAHKLHYSINLARKTRVINPWFGGNQSAPNDIYFLRKRIY